jgi:hypothetical protein
MSLPAADELGSRRSQINLWRPDNCGHLVAIPTAWSSFARALCRMLATRHVGGDNNRDPRAGAHSPEMRDVWCRDAKSIS